MNQKVLTLIVMLCLAGPAFAQMGGGGRSGGGQSGGLWNAMVSQLGLTSAQQSQLQPIYAAFEQQEQSLHQSCRQQLSGILTPQQMQALHQQHMQAQGPPNFDSLGLSSDQKTRVQAILQQIHTQMSSLRNNLKSQIEPMLTSDQRTRLEQLLAGPPR